MEIDIHCHKRSSPENIELLNLDVNADFNEVKSYFSLGIHPWYIEELSLSHALRQLEHFGRHPMLLAFGECGLDKKVATPMPFQIEVFSAQIAMAKRFDKPLIIHCVHAYNELLELKKKLAADQIWLIHGFNAHSALAAQLLKQNCYLSFGQALLHNTGKARQTFSCIPLDRLFLETDARNDITIGEIYAAAARIRGLELPELQRQIVANFKRVFTHE